MTTSIDTAHITRAISLAAGHSTDGAHGPFGAVVARGDAVVGEGWNCVVADHDPTAHAEVMAIRRACETLRTHSLDGCTIYCSCEPCPMCLAAIYWAHLDRVVYAATRDDAAAIGFSDAFIYDEIPRCASDRSVPMVQLSRPAALAVLQDWKDNPCRQEY